MPTLRIEAPPAATAEIAEPAGGRLLDLCDDAGARVAFSCRGGTCGTCVVEVLEGDEWLEPPGDDERETLELLGEPPGRRLACVAVVRPGDGRLRLRVLP
ncbi:MAG: (2Fe-2S)-binding protein [Myxococcales bacterium]|nr:MAG: (2Fe-2S)-binding protein [Myxococcales bacterium]